MSIKLRKNKKPARSGATAHGFTIVALPKNQKLRELILADNITTSGGRRSVHRRRNSSQS